MDENRGSTDGMYNIFNKQLQSIKKHKKSQDQQQIHTPTPQSFVRSVKQKKNKQKKGCNRVICQKIGSSKWSVSTQIILGLIIVSVFFITSVMITLGINLQINYSWLKSNAESYIKNQTEQNILVSMEEFQGSINSLMLSYKNSMDIISDVILTKMGQDTGIYDYDIINSFPLSGHGNLLYGNDDLPDGYEKDTISPTDRGNIGLYNQLGYLQAKQSFHQNQSAQEINDSLLLLEYFLKDWYLIEQLISFVQTIFIGFPIEVDQQDDDCLFWTFPGGILKDIGTNEDNLYICQDRPWYETYTIYQNSSNKQEIKDKTFAIGYVDFKIKQPIITFTKLLLNDDLNLVGIMGLDVTVDDFQKVYDSVELYETGKLILLKNNGFVLNDPFGTSGQYNIFDEQKTGFGLDILGIIQNEALYTQQKNEQRLSEVKNVRGIEYLITCQFLEDFQEFDELKLILCIFVNKSDSFSTVDKTLEKINNLYRYILYISAIMLTVVFIIVVINFFRITNILIKPLKQLSQFADYYLQNSEDKDHPITQLDFEKIPEIKGIGSLQYLINEFSQIIKGMSLERSAKMEMMVNQKKLHYLEEANSGTSFEKWSEKLQKQPENNNGLSYSRYIQLLGSKTMSQNMHENNHRRKDFYLGDNSSEEDEIFNSEDEEDDENDGEDSNEYPEELENTEKYMSYMPSDDITDNKKKNDDYPYFQKNLDSEDYQSLDTQKLKNLQIPRVLNNNFAEEIKEEDENQIQQTPLGGVNQFTFQKDIDSQRKLSQQTQQESQRKLSILQQQNFVQTPVNYKDEIQQYNNYNDYSQVSDQLLNQMTDRGNSVQRLTEDNKNNELSILNQNGNHQGEVFQRKVQNDSDKESIDSDNISIGENIRFDHDDHDDRRNKIRKNFEIKFAQSFLDCKKYN